MPQDHKAYPTLTKVIVTSVRDNGGINRFRPEEDVLEKLDEVLGSEGVYHSDLAALEQWLNALSEEDLETVIGGEDSDMKAVLESAPRMGGPEACSAEDFIYQTYEHCI